MTAEQVPLTEDSQAFVDSVTRRGEHATAAEVVDLALHQMEQRRRVSGREVRAPDAHRSAGRNREAEAVRVDNPLE